MGGATTIRRVNRLLQTKTGISRLYDARYLGQSVQ
jgi:hypothetical protein